MFKNIPKKKLKTLQKLIQKFLFLYYTITLHWRIKDKFFSLLKK